jgi:hypothetical protein
MKFSQSLLGYQACDKLTKTQEDSKSTKHNMWVSDILGLNCRLDISKYTKFSPRKNCVNRALTETFESIDYIVYLFG